MELHERARQGDVEGARRALDAGALVDLRDPGTDLTALAAAAGSRDGSRALVELLLSRGADPNAVCGVKRRESVLLHACRSRGVERLLALLDAGADPAYRDDSGYHALLHVFSREGDDPLLPDAVRLLIARGAPLDAASVHGETPLGRASLRGYFDVIALLLEAGADPAPLRWTPLHRAAAVGTVDELRRDLARALALEARDHRGRTAWLLAAQVGCPEKLELLAAAGADRRARSREERHALQLAIEAGHLPAVDWLLAHGAEPDEPGREDRTPLMVAAGEGEAAIVARLLAAGAELHRTSPRGYAAIDGAGSVEVLRLLQAAGAETTSYSGSLRRALTRVEGVPIERGCSLTDFRAGRGRRFGAANPERMDVPFWRAMVRVRSGPWPVRKAFALREERGEAVWCYDRYGHSFTELGDGRFVEVGGEHEDWYDPDFCIYNDVVVYDGLGGFTILGYPRDLLPPTDFHSATLVDGWLYLLGSLGYVGERRPGRAQALRLSVADLHVERLETHGDDPGWIAKHRARFAPPASIHIRGGRVWTPGGMVDNVDEFALDLRTLGWRRLSTTTEEPAAS